MTTLQTALTPPHQTNSDAHTTVKGLWLWLARAFWAVLCGSSLLTFGTLIPLIVRQHDFGSWTIERSAALFGLSTIGGAYQVYALIFLSLRYAAVAVFLGVAFYIFWRKADDWLAILVSAMLLTLPHFFSLGGYTQDWYRYPAPFAQWMQDLLQFVTLAGLSLLFTIFFLFPDGRVVPAWMRVFVPLPTLFILLGWGITTLHIVSLPDETLAWLAVLFGCAVLFALVVWAQLVRYRHSSTPAQQASTRLVVASLVGIGMGFLLMLLLNFGASGFMETPLGAFTSSLLQIVTAVLLPLAFGVAMLRDQLWAGERVLRRAFVYGALTAILVVVYILIVGTLSEFIRGTNNLVITTIATGMVALLFQTLRARLQAVINRFLYGERDEPFRVLNQLGAQLENTLAPDAALPLIVQTITRTMRVPYAAIVLVTANGRETTAYGTPTEQQMELPLRYQNEAVGELVIAPRAPNEKFTPADLQLLTNLARQAGAVAYTARLNAQLQHSRERIITEREQERRRLRRDLHDGLGPTLASQTLKLDAALELIHGEDAGNAGARKILQDVKAQTQNTVADIRRIVYELRPPALDDLGLLGALRAHLAQYNEVNGLHITFDAPAELPPLSAAVQVNAYRIVLEAVTNVVRHAHATHCVVQITANGTLHLEVRDDGTGLPENVQMGVGIASMRERAEELGGTFHIERRAPHGTRMTAELPLKRETGSWQ